VAARYTSAALLTADDDGKHVHTQRTALPAHRFAALALSGLSPSYLVQYSISLMPKVLCSCGCGSRVTRQTQANHLAGKHLPAQAKLAQAKQAIKDAARKAKSALRRGRDAIKQAVVPSSCERSPDPLTNNEIPCEGKDIPQVPDVSGSPPPKFTSPPAISESPVPCSVSAQAL
jgi:hypothetical protein